MVSPMIDWVWKGENSENISYLLMVGSVVLCGLADGLVQPESFLDSTCNQYLRGLPLQAMNIF